MLLEESMNCTKMPYNSRERAERAMTALIRHDPLKAPTAIYYCTACDAYHLTTRPHRKGRRGRR